MGWGKQDDGFYDHPKVMALPREVRNDACGLYWRAVSYCNRQLTDGFVSASALEMLDARPESVEALTRVHLFDRARDGRLIHDFLDFNFSREWVEARKKVKAEAGRQGGIKSGQARKRARYRPSKQGATKGEAATKHRASGLVEANAKQNRTPNPNPNPNPNPGDSAPPIGGAGRAHDVSDVAALVEDLIGRPFSFGPGSRILETLRADVLEQGSGRVVTELRRFRDAHPGPIDAAGLVFGTHKAMYPIPDAPRNGSTPKPKGYQPDMEAVRDVVDR